MYYLPPRSRKCEKSFLTSGVSLGREENELRGLKWQLPCNTTLETLFPWNVLLTIILFNESTLGSITFQNIKHNMEGDMWGMFVYWMNSPELGFLIQLRPILGRDTVADWRCLLITSSENIPVETKFIINEVLRQQYMAFYSRCEFTCTCQFTPTEKKVGFPQIFFRNFDNYW